MRKKVINRGRAKSSGTMPGRAAAPAFLTLPKLSPGVQLEINAVAGDAFALEMLSMMSNCIDLSLSSGTLSDIMNPADTVDKLLCSRVSGWIYRGYDYTAMDMVFCPDLAIVHPEVADQEFSDSFYPDGPVLFLQMTGDEYRECDASYLRTIPEAEAKAILDVIDASPVYIMTPRELLNQVSCNYWMGSPDETDRIEEIRAEFKDDETEDIDEEKRDAMEEEIAQFCPITRDDFNIAYPPWMFKKIKHSVTLPDPAKKLKAANKRYYAAYKKHKLAREYINGTLPGIRLIGLESETLQADGIFEKLWDDTIEETYNAYSGETYLCPFVLPFKIGGYEKAVAVLEVFRAYLDCLNATAELLRWIASKSPQKLKVTA